MYTRDWMLVFMEQWKLTSGRNTTSLKRKWGRQWQRTTSLKCIWGLMSKPWPWKTSRLPFTRLVCTHSIPMSLLTTWWHRASKLWLLQSLHTPLSSPDLSTPSWRPFNKSTGLLSWMLQAATYLTPLPPPLHPITTPNATPWPLDPKTLTPPCFLQLPSTTDCSQTTFAKMALHSWSLVTTPSVRSLMY